MDRLPIDDVLIHVRDTLATDGRVGELGLEVTCEEEVLVVRGAISTEARQSAVCELVIEVLRQYDLELDVRDETRVPAALPPDREPERL
jgi:hypothetical protein